MLAYIMFIFLVLFLFFLDNKYKTKNNFFEKSSIVIIMIFSAIRFDTGWDYMSYFNIIKYNDRFQYYRFEPFNRFIFNIARYFDNVQLFFLFYAILTPVLYYLVIKKYSTNRHLSIYIFITESLFLLTTFSSLRQGIAAAIIFFGTKYIVEKNFLKFFITVFMATGFHSSAVITIIFYPIYFIRLEKRKLLILLLIFPFFKEFLLVLSNYLLPQYAVYFSQSADSGGLLAFLYLFYGLLAFLAYDNRASDKNKYFVTMSILGALGFYMFSDFRAVSRIFRYFLSYMILALPLICRKIKEKKLIEIGMYSFFTFIFFLALLISMQNVKKTPLVPYNSIFSQKIEFFKIVR